MNNAQRAMETGTREAGDLYGQYANDANGALESASMQAIARALGVSEDVAAQLLAASEAGAGAVDSATGTAVQGINDAAAQANAGLDPYAQSGSDAITRLSSLLTNGPKAVNLQEDPGYQFRLQEGNKAIERSAAARGGALGGAAVKAAARYNSGLASQEYQNAWERSRADHNLSVSGLTTLSELGLRATGQKGQNTTEAARLAGTLGLTGATTAAGMRIGGTEAAGSVRTRAAEYAGDMDWRRGSGVSSNLLSVGNFKGQMALERAQSVAAGHMGRANAWNGMLNSIGKAGDSIISGGLSGGTTGWSWRGAAGGRTS